MKASAPLHLFHDWVEAASWRQPALDHAARLVRRTLRPLVDRMAPAQTTAARPATVSVIVPCYRYGHFLPDSVGSALAQADVVVEVIIVDDASPDDSGAVADALAAADPRVKVVHNPTNLGHVRAFNCGYEVASGEFIVRLDADDLLTPGSLSRAVALFDAFPQVGLVYGHPRHFTSATPPAGRIGDVSWTVWSGQDWVRERCELGVNCITTPEAIVRASVMADVGPLNTRLRFAQDMEMWLRVAAASDVGRVNGVDQALHRDHEASMSSNEGSGALLDLSERQTVFTEFFRRMGAGLRSVDELDGAWRTALAREALDRVTHARDRGRLDAEEAGQLRHFAEALVGPEGVAQRWPARLEAPPRKASATMRVVRQRLTDELRFLRWARTGV